MAFDTAKLVLIGHGRGNKFYLHDAGDDTMATVKTAGYYNNSDDFTNFAVDDVIISLCTDGDFMHKVGAVSSGSITTYQVSNLGPWNGVVGTASAALSEGISEIGTGTATAFVLPAPVIGRRVTVVQTGTATGGRTVVTDATSTTLSGAGGRTVTLDGQGDCVDLLGVSTSRWAIVDGSGIALS